MLSTLSTWVQRAQRARQQSSQQYRKKINKIIKHALPIHCHYEECAASTNEEDPSNGEKLGCSAYEDGRVARYGPGVTKNKNIFLEHSLEHSLA